MNEEPKHCLDVGNTQRRIRFPPDNRTIANHRRSFGFQRRNFESGKPVDVNSAPTLWCASKFGNFEEYLSDLQIKMAKLLDERISHIIPEDNMPVDIHFETTPGGYYTLATYEGVKNGRSQFRFRLDNVVFAFHYPDEKRRTAFLTGLTNTTDHEIRHHLDRRFLRYWQHVLHLNEHLDKLELPKTPFGERSTTSLLREYLAKIRLEGLAEFDEFVVYPSSQEYLAKETKVAEDGVKLLQNRQFIDRIDWNRFTKEIGFCPYRQGGNIFRVIALAERASAEGLPAMPLDKLITDHPMDYVGIVFWKKFDQYSQLLRKVAGINTFKGFVDYYQRCADQLMLQDNERILTPELGKILIGYEERGIGNVVSLVEKLPQGSATTF